MANIKLPFIKWRDGRPRFEPSGRELALGFKGCALRHPDGRWFTFEEARDFADARLEEIKHARVVGGRKGAAAPLRGRTVADLIADWLEALEARVTDKLDPIAPDTLRSYRGTAAALIWRPEDRAAACERRKKERAAKLLGTPAAAPKRELELFGATRVEAITKVELTKMFRTIAHERGHHMAHGAIAAFSAAWTWGRSNERWRLGPNPRHELELVRPKGRIVIYTDAEIRALDAAAAELGRPSIGDAIWLGVFTAQRQRDRLLMRDELGDDGRRRIRQSKTGALVAFPDAPALTERLDAARARVAAIKLKKGTRPDTIVVDEATGNAYLQDTFRHWFGAVRKAAIAGNPATGRAPCPTLAGKRDQDLRDTAVTWLARSGCSLLELCAISGHSPQSVQTIINHYMGDRDALADAAIDKLTGWIDREGIKL
jgi:hypothetical protein